MAIHKFVFLIIILMTKACLSSGTTYYVSNSGSDSNNGTSTTTPWQTISKVNGETFSAGDSILFRKGDTWREELVIPNSGTPGSEIYFGAYGTGDMPNIFGSIQATSWTETGTSNIWQSSTSMNDPYNSSSYPAGYPGNVFFHETDDIVNWGVHQSDLSELTEEYDWTWIANTLYVYSSTDPDSRYTSVEAVQRDRGIYLNEQSYLIFDSFNLRYFILAGIKDVYNATIRHGLEVKNCEIAYTCERAGVVGYGISAPYNNSWYHDNWIHDHGRRCININPNAYEVVYNVLIEDNKIGASHHSGIDVASNSANSIDSIIIRHITVSCSQTSEINPFF